MDLKTEAEKHHLEAQQQRTVGKVASLWARRFSSTAPMLALCPASNREDTQRLNPLCEGIICPILLKLTLYTP